MLKATVSGSFHRHMGAIYEAVGDLRVRGVDVLSPSDPRVVDHIGEFLFVASDRLRSIKLVQDRHLEAIRASDFLLVVCPDGYTGASTSGEIMAAAVLGVPVFSLHEASDVTLGCYVMKLPSLEAVLARVSLRDAERGSSHVLLDPAGVVDDTIALLERLAPALTMRGSAKTAELQFADTRARLSASFGLGHGK